MKRKTSCIIARQSIESGASSEQEKRRGQTNFGGKKTPAPGLKNAKRVVPRKGKGEEGKGPVNMTLHRKIAVAVKGHLQTNRKSPDKRPSPKKPTTRKRGEEHQGVGGNAVKNVRRNNWAMSLNRKATWKGFEEIKFLFGKEKHALGEIGRKEVIRASHVFRCGATARGVSK